MASEPNENMPWEASDTKRPASPGAPLGMPGPRSSLSLDGQAPPPQAPVAPPEAAPRDMLAEGATRARNMGTALVMIAVLLTRYVATRVVWGQLDLLARRALVVATRLLQAVYVLAKPHLDTLRTRAQATGNQAFRAVLMALINVVGPLEEALLKLFGLARREAAKLAERGGRTLGQVLTAMAGAVSQAVQAGLTKPVVQKLVYRLVKILEDAHR